MVASAKRLAHLERTAVGHRGSPDGAVGALRLRLLEGQRVAVALEILGGELREGVNAGRGMWLVGVPHEAGVG